MYSIGGIPFHNSVSTTSLHIINLIATSVAMNYVACLNATIVFQLEKMR